ncbi:hypothetical protein BP6252_01138 [Coleophoma cylindrospora]|uniref:HTH araC/xylS-type domain-containing protein n=1 Tax=Coleophoma cylindrospora TaxID=1849047 RepID=A0A3D8SS18_9HELO|nr:hypothetical protein BP6252_01138 [Coleophoma cylindrospora]
MQRPFTTAASRWAALQSRDPRASDAFIYSVITTKIYCRPTCPSRLARRANIIFHQDATEAEAAGFRACKRCLPGLSSTDYAAEENKAKLVVEKVADLLGKELSGGKVAKKWTVRMLATEVGLTESYFCRLFKKEVGCTVGEFRAKLASLQQELERKKENERGNLMSTSCAKATPETFEAPMEQCALGTSETYLDMTDIHWNTAFRTADEYNLDLIHLDNYFDTSGCNVVDFPEPIEEDGFQFLDLSSFVETS